MHTANERETKLETQDADRFLAIHELRRLWQTETITKDQYLANRARLQGTVASVSRGINNLTRSPRLSSAVATALHYSFIRVHFKASSWRKLTQGHFYEVRKLAWSSR